MKLIGGLFKLVFHPSTFAKEQTLVDQIHVNGKCHCGNVSLSGSADANMIIACHCTDCQTFSGAPYRAVVIITRENITIYGDLNTQRSLKAATNASKGSVGFVGRKFMQERQMDQCIMFGLDFLNNINPWLP